MGINTSSTFKIL